MKILSISRFFRKFLGNRFLFEFFSLEKLISHFSRFFSKISWKSIFFEFFSSEKEISAIFRKILQIRFFSNFSLGAVILRREAKKKLALQKLTERSKKKNSKKRSWKKKPKKRVKKGANKEPYSFFCFWVFAAWHWRFLSEVWILISSKATRALV